MGLLADEEIDQALHTVLTECERAVVAMRFGLDSGGPATLAEAGERLGVTRERIRQIGARAVHKLRSLLRADVSGRASAAR